MRKRILVKGPLLSRSGYGEQSRFALQALRSREDLYDIYILNIPWGRTGQITANTQDFEFINFCIMKTAQYIQHQGTFDMSLQITVPNEFEKIAPINIGYTAGIETTKVAPQWIEKCNAFMDKVIVVSDHSKNVFERTVYTATDQQTGEEIPNWGMQVPVTSVNYSVRHNEPEELEINLETDINFLTVAQWGPRKNLDNTIRWFVETFRDRADVGLVLKTSTQSDSTMDAYHTGKRLESLLNQVGDHECKVYLVHGDLNPGQLAWLYEHPTMKAMINIGHGEGFGLPLFEAACHGLPLLTVTWSGQMDFLCKPNKKGKRVPRCIRVDYDLKPVQKEAVWEGVIQADSHWCYAKENSYKKALMESLVKETHYRNEATTLQNHILETFATDKLNAEFISALEILTTEEAQEWSDNLSDLEMS